MTENYFELLDPGLLKDFVDQADSENMNFEDWLQEALFIRRQVYICPKCLYNGHPIIALHRSPARVCWCSCHKGESR